MTANESQIGGTHYKSEYEHWDLVIRVGMGYLEGTTTKYVSRWRKKGGMQDLRKALHYLDKLMEVEKDYIRPKCDLTLENIKNQVVRFSIINNLSILEQEFILALCTYKTNIDLLEARYVLEEIMEHVYEPNYPGTPEDGGHHETQPV